MCQDSVGLNARRINIIIGIISSISTTTLILIAAFLSKNLLLERLRHELQKEHSKYLDELQWNRKTQEKASRVAEYLALVRNLEEKSSKSNYERANKLSWELAMWLPEHIQTNDTGDC